MEFPEISDNAIAFILLIVLFDALSFIPLQNDDISKKYEKLYGFWRATLFRYFVALPFALILTVAFIYFKNNGILDPNTIVPGIVFSLIFMFVLFSYYRVFTDLDLYDKTVTSLIFTAN